MSRALESDADSRAAAGSRPLCWFWPLWCVVLGLAVAVTIAATHAPPFPGDVPAARVVQHLAAVPGTAALAQLLNADLAGSGVVAVVVVVVTAFLVARRWSLAVWFIVANVLRSGSTVLKWLTGRPRPTAALVRVGEWPTDTSFPSGHAFGALLCYGSLALLIEYTGLPRVARRSIQAGCGVIILLAGFARVYVGAHWPSDVLGAYLWGGLVLSAAWHAARARGAAAARPESVWPLCSRGDSVDCSRPATRSKANHTG